MTAAHSGPTRILFSSPRGRTAKYEAETDETVIYDEVVRQGGVRIERHEGGAKVKVIERAPVIRRTVIAKGLDRDAAKAAMKRGAKVTGVLAPGQSVKVTDGMEFTVARTGGS